MAGTLKHSEVQSLRCIRIIGDFQLHHTFLRRCNKHKEIFDNSYFIEIFNSFNKYCLEKNYSSFTISNFMNRVTRFLDYAVSQRVESCNKLTLTLINNYIKTLAGYANKSIELMLYSLRIFFKFLYMKEETNTDFSVKIPMIKLRKQTRIPSAWAAEDLKKLISAIDRGSPIGKRDYAIILLACRLGLRCTDIKNLTIDNFHWEDKQIVFVQSKTKMLLSLPLTPEIGWVVIDYLKYGRPKVNTKYIFVLHRAPFLPFSAENHLNQIIKKYIRLAHLSISKKKIGMHSLRHTLASMLLESNTPLPVISDILGHMNTESTAVYLKVDIEKLKECPLYLKEDTCHD